MPNIWRVPSLLMEIQIFTAKCKLQTFNMPDMLLFHSTNSPKYYLYKKWNGPREIKNFEQYHPKQSSPLFLKSKINADKTNILIPYIQCLDFVELLFLQKNDQNISDKHWTSYWTVHHYIYKQAHSHPQLIWNWCLFTALCCHILTSSWSLDGRKGLARL